MTYTVQTGLDRLINNEGLQSKVNGNFAYLCHQSSVISHSLESGVSGLKKIFKKKFKKLFTPQHGMFGDVQANMIETSSGYNQYFDLPVYSLYSETRSPTDEMLSGIDTLIIDLQDVGTRVYTYIHTMTLAMEACAKKDIKVVILDRPNPVNGITIEGNILETEYSSFVGLHPVPMRHGLTMCEMAEYVRSYCNIECDLSVIPMQGWERGMDYHETGLPWIIPSPNMPHVETAYPYVGAVLLEGCSVSEGRGTTRVFEFFGHLSIEPYSWLNEFLKTLKEFNLEGFVLRPVFFIPTFDKFKNQTIGGYQVHITDKHIFRPWRFFQVFLRELRRTLPESLVWNSPPYEYEYKKLPIDILNGSAAIREWVDSLGSAEDLEKLEKEGYGTYLNQRSNILLY